MKMSLVFLVFVLVAGCVPLTRLGLSGAPGDAASTEEDGQTEVLERFLAQKRARSDSAAVDQPYIAVMLFVDESGFRKGVWDLEQEMPHLFSSRISAQPDWRVVPYEVVKEVRGGNKKFDTEDALAAGRRMEADILLFGTLVDYDMRRIRVGDPLLGGYKSYTGVAEIEMRALRVADGSEMGSISARQEPIDRGLGLDLLGKPREQDLQFARLDQIDFGSERFEATVIGQATLAVMDDLANQLVELLRPSGLKLGRQPAEILSVYGDEIFINLGSDNALRLGYRFAVFPGPERAVPNAGDVSQRLGVVEVVDIIGGRVSKVRILEKRSELAAGDRLRLLGREREGGP